MAKETLTVKNFGPIREAYLDLRKVTVLIGEQASGKSVLAKLVGIFGDLLLEGKLLDVVWEFYNLRSFVNEKSAILFSGDFFSHSFGNVAYSKTVKDSILEYFQEYQKSREQWERDLLISQTKGIADEEREKFRTNREEMRIRRKYLADIGGTPKYFPAERSLVSVLSKSIFQLVDNEIKMPRFLTDFAAEYEIARQAVSQFEIRFLDITYTFQEGKDKVIFGRNQEIELPESATGFQTAIPMAVVIESLQEKGKHIFIIEEPELNLYPTTQKKLVEYLIEKCTKGDNRLIITTHSPYILTALNNCIQARNTLREHPEHAEEVAKLVRLESQIDFENVMAYFVADGTAKPIMNNDNRLIDANALDYISDELSETFDRLLDLEMQPA